ncbi:hypothetical protein OCF61_21125 [Bacillus cereus]|nr:hypothetical protein [Bacillus cereus]
MLKVQKKRHPKVSSFNLNHFNFGVPPHAHQAKKNNYPQNENFRSSLLDKA